MQIKPSTAAGELIWITGVDSDSDRNVRAGCAYLRYCGYAWDEGIGWGGGYGWNGWRGGGPRNMEPDQGRGARGGQVGRVTPSQGGVLGGQLGGHLEHFPISQLHNRSL